MAWFHAAITANIEIPAFLCSYHSHIFPLRFCTLAGTTGHRHFDLMRGTQALVTMLQRHRQPGRVLHAIATPGRTDAGFHRAQRLAIGVPGFKPGIHQFLPDGRKLLQACAKEIDTLTTGDFAVKLIAFGYLPDGNQPIRRDLAGRHTRHNGVGSVFLNIGEITVIGILQRQVRRFEQILIPAGGQNRPDQRLTHLAALPVTIAADQLRESANMIDAHQMMDLLARVREVFANIFFHFHALRRQLVFHHLFNQRAATAAAGGRFGTTFDGPHVAGPRNDRLTNIALADVMTGTNLRAVWQCRHAERFGGATCKRRQNQAFRLRRQRQPVEHGLQQRRIVAGVPYQYTAE